MYKEHVCVYMDGYTHFHTDTGTEERTYIPTHIYLHTYMHSIGLSIIKTFTLHSIYPLSSTFKAMQSVRKRTGLKF